MEGLHDDVAFILEQSGLYKATFPNSEEQHSEFESNLDSLVHQACDERARLQKAMQCSGAMFETNMQCVSYILSLKRENSTQKASFDREKEVQTLITAISLNRFLSSL
jgi:hypothetical protein